MLDALAHRARLNDMLIVAILLSYFVGVGPAFAAPSTGAAAGTSVGASSSAQYELKLRTVVSGFEKQLGTLQDWEKRIFQEEIIPQHRRFIRSHRASADGVVADVDLDAIRNYLGFYAPKVLESQRPVLIVGLKYEPGCSKCALAHPEIRKLVTERLQRRGFVPIFPSERELDPQASGSNLEVKLQELAGKQKSSGFLMVQWIRAPMDEDHPGDNRFQIRSILSVKDFHRAEGEQEIFATESIENSANELLTDFFSELGVKSEKAGGRSVDDQKEAMVLEVNGVRDFAHFGELKTQLQELLKDVATVDEIKMSRGRAIFGVMTQKNLSDVQALLNGKIVDKGKPLSVGKAGSSEEESPALRIDIQ